MFRTWVTYPHSIILQHTKWCFSKGPSLSHRTRCFGLAVATASATHFSLPRTPRQTGGFHKWSYPKWMVYSGKSQSIMDDLEVFFPHFRKPPLKLKHIWTYLNHKPHQSTLYLMSAQCQHGAWKLQPTSACVASWLHHHREKPGNIVTNGNTKTDLLMGKSWKVYYFPCSLVLGLSILYHWRSSHQFWLDAKPFSMWSLIEMLFPASHVWLIPDRPSQWPPALPIRRHLTPAERGSVVPMWTRNSRRFELVMGVPRNHPSH